MKAGSLLRVRKLPRISRGSVATDFGVTVSSVTNNVTNLLPILAVKEFLNCSAFGEVQSGIMIAKFSDAWWSVTCYFCATVYARPRLQDHHSSLSHSRHSRSTKSTQLLFCGFYHLLCHVEHYLLSACMCVHLFLLLMNELLH